MSSLTGKRKYVTSNTTLQFPTQTTSASAVCTSSFSIAAASDGTWNTQRVRYATGIFSNTASFWHAHHQHQCPLPFGTVRLAPASSALVSHTAASSACLRVLGGRPVPVSHNYFSIISPFASWAISTRRQNGTSITPSFRKLGDQCQHHPHCWPLILSALLVLGDQRQHHQHQQLLVSHHQHCWALVSHDAASSALQATILHVLGDDHRHHQHQWPRISGIGRPDSLPSASMILGRVLPFFGAHPGRMAPASSASVASRLRFWETSASIISISGVGSEYILSISGRPSEVRRSDSESQTLNLKSKPRH